MNENEIVEGLLEITDLEEIIMALFYYRVDDIDETLNQEELGDDDLEYAKDQFESLEKIIQFAESCVDDEELIEEMHETYEAISADLGNNKEVVLYDYNKN